MPIQIIPTIGSEKQRWAWMQNSIHVSTADMEAKGVTMSANRSASSTDRAFVAGE